MSARIHSRPLLARKKSTRRDGSAISTPTFNFWQTAEGQRGVRFKWLIGCGTWVSLLLCAVTLPAQTAAPRLGDALSQESLAQLSADVERLGDPVRGALAFYRPELNCRTCHDASFNRGRTLGPDLAEIREVSRETLIQAILEPSKEIRRGYETTQLLLQDGRQLAGIVSRRTEDSLWLERIDEREQPLEIKLEDIEDEQVSELSTMPAGLAHQLGSRSEFLDLIRYLEEIAAGGGARGIQLRPPQALAQLAPLPEYESRVDHRALIGSWNDETLAAGAEIYRLRCASCHGDLNSEGSMPTSLRFQSGNFKRGGDPYSIYQTLTHGYGLMIPQRWMVPEQKYAVIHYLRETFLREHNPAAYQPIDEAYLSSLPAGDTRGPRAPRAEPWVAMDYGPSLFNTIEMSDDQSLIAQKGLAIRLDEGVGGVAAGNNWWLFDHDTLSWPGVWSGNFLDYNGIHFNGVHGQHPRIGGQIVLGQDAGPGWANPQTQSFEDPRLRGRDERPYGPLPRDWGQYLGMYRYGLQTIVHYRVGATPIWEMPARVETAGGPLWVRHLNLGPRSQPLRLRVATAPESLTWKAQESGWQTTGDAGGEKAASAPRGYWEFSAEDDPATLAAQGLSWTARVRTREDGTLVALTQARERWSPGGITWFLRDGRPTVDIGWVGAVQASRAVNDGNWHDLAVIWDPPQQRIGFRIDAAPVEWRALEFPEPLDQAVWRLGFTNDDFPETSLWTGEVERVSRWAGVLSNADWELWRQKKPPSAPSSLLDQWESAEPAAPWESSGGVVWEWRGSDDTTAAVGPWNVQAWTAEQNWPQSQWTVDGQHLCLDVPAGENPLQFVVGWQVGGGSEASESRAELAREMPPLNLASLTQGGPANWPTELETSLGSMFESDGPWQVDVFEMPTDNPGNCRLRLTGLDFWPGEDALAVCTWDGSVWKVTGIQQTAAGAPLRWRRIAAGLFQPLGIKFRDRQLFVTCRDQLVALHDLNDDGEMDWYQCFNNDHQVTEHFHEFAMGLQTDSEGNFYYAKSARHALPAVVPHHGTLLKVSADGQRTEILANGFRAANGVCLNPDGSFLVTDQEGHWNPKNRINWVRPGEFYGNMFGYHQVTDSSDDAMTPPLCWITNQMDRSPAELLWVDSPQWGPLEGALLNLSYGYGKMYVVLSEQKGELRQGGVCAWEIPSFPTGIMRGRFSPQDGQLYACGMFAWSSTQEQPGGLYRVRYRGGAIHLPVAWETAPKRVTLTFTDPLDPAAVALLTNYRITAWDLKRTASYGSDHHNERQWEVTAAQLSADGRSVQLTIPDLAPTWGLEIAYTLRGADGQIVHNKIHGTIHRLD